MAEGSIAVQKCFCWLSNYSFLSLVKITKCISIWSCFKENIIELDEKIICAITDDGRRTHGEQIDRTFTTKLLPLAVLLSLLALTTKFWQRIPLNNTSNFEYAVVLDAGSTGSRVLGFTFQRDPETQSLRLLDELWMQVKPGLSAYHVSFISYFTIEWSG